MRLLPAAFVLGCPPESSPEKNKLQMVSITFQEDDFHSNDVKFISHHPIYTYNQLILLMPIVGTNSALIRNDLETI